MGRGPLGRVAAAAITLLGLVASTPMFADADADAEPGGRAGKPACAPEAELCLLDHGPWTAPDSITYSGPALAGELEVRARQGSRRMMLKKIKVVDSGATTKTWRVVLPAGLRAAKTSLRARAPSAGLERVDTGRVRSLVRKVHLDLKKSGSSRAAVLRLRQRGPTRARINLRASGSYPAERSERFRSLKTSKLLRGSGAKRVRLPVKQIKQRCARYSSCRLVATAKVSALGYGLERRRARTSVPTPPERPSGGLGFVPDSTPTAGSGGRRYSYAIYVEHGVKIDRKGFASDVWETLSDRRSWIASGRVSFRGVASRGAANTRIILASPRTVDRLCAPLATRGYVSCTQGSSVILNLDRWRHAVPHFKSRLTYRRMLVNHEIGHRIGQSHRSCSGRGNKAPVMQQQTYGLAGCRANPWPLSGELGTAKRGSVRASRSAR